MAFTGIAYVHEVVSDLDAACEFFTDKLGFVLNTNQPGVRGLAMGAGYLVLNQSDAGSAPSGGSGSVCVLVDDVDAYRGILDGRGVAVGPIADHPWGQRDFYLTDPDGYRWCFAQLAAR